MKIEKMNSQKAIAIVGVGARLPGALSANAFWENIKNSVSAIQEVPIERWDPDLYWDPDRNAPDKTYSKIGGWITDYTFDRKGFRLPPTLVQRTDPTQLLTLSAVKEAMEDSGYDKKEFNRDRCAVILGNALGGDLRDDTNLRVQVAEINQAIRQSIGDLSFGNMSEGQIEQLVESVSKKIKAKSPIINEDSMPGELANIVAGRVAQLFDLRGPNYTCDAACASTLAAMESSIYGLRSGQYDMVVTGGADRAMGAPTFVKFSKIGALSDTGSRPFDAGANGFVMGEGVGILILKRLEDAVRDDDSIYAVIRGIGGSSDGKGKAITAPNPRGQMHALRRAYNDAGFGPSTISLVEAHGTSTPVGDPAEFRSVREVFSQDDKPEFEVGLGSVKSMIGHLKSAAAAASMIKIAFALREKVKPPTINVVNENPALEIENTAFKVQKELEPWETKPGTPRRAGISAFGFGGTNFHAILEEYDPEGSKGKFISTPSSTAPMTSKPSKKSASKTSKAQTTMQPDMKKYSDGILGFDADDYPSLVSSFKTFCATFQSDPTKAIEENSISFSATKRAGTTRLAMVFTSLEDLKKKVPKTEKALAKKKGWKLLQNQGVFFSDSANTGKVAMLFPGQGSQYLGMLGALRERFPVVQDTFDEADEIMTPVLNKKISSIIFPDPKEDEFEAFKALTKTEITQPAVLTADTALLRLLRHLGVEADVVAGHSLGEYGACVAAGVMSFPSALKTVATRGTEMANATPMNGDSGLMLGVPTDAKTVEDVLAKIDGYAVCANKNCPNQTIVAGETKTVEKAEKAFREMGLSTVILPVSHAFHSKVVAAASVPLRKHLSTIDISVPKIPILTNVTGDFYPTGKGVEDEIRDLLSEQVAAPVEYIALIERMYEKGTRVFIEVGPKRAQTSFVSDILSKRDHRALYTNHPKAGDVLSFYSALANLWSVSVWQGANNKTIQTPAEENVASSPAPAPSTSAAPAGKPDVLSTIIEVLCEKTGYDADEIEADFELEADLGIDTVKQAEIMGSVRELYALEKDDEFRLSEYPTLNHLTQYVIDKGGKQSGLTTPQAPPVSAAATPKREDASVAGTVNTDEILQTIIGILCEKTGYDNDEIEADFELEADLGIDTVKQAEIMGSVRELYALEKDDEFRLSEYPTLNHLTRYVVERCDGSAVPSTEAKTSAVPVEKSEVQRSSDQTQNPAHSKASVLEKIVSILCEKTGYDADEIEADFELEADLGIDTVKQAEIMASVREVYALEKDDAFRLAEYPTLNHLADYVIAKNPTSSTQTAPANSQTAAPMITPTNVLTHEAVVATIIGTLCEKTGYDADEIEVEFELEADLGIDTVKQAEIMATVREIYALQKDDEFRLAEYPTINRLAEYVLQSPISTDEVDVAKAAEKSSIAPPPKPVGKIVQNQARDNRITQHAIKAKVVVSGCALGLPGLPEVFDEDAVDKLLDGTNMILPLDDNARKAMTNKGIVRLIKHDSGGGDLVPVEDTKDVIKLAGRAGDFELSKWGISDRIRDTIDETSQMAIAAGFNALRDAGIPLIPRFRTTTQGKKVTVGYTLPEEIGEETGVIFATAFAGQDALIDELKASNEKDYQFDHRYLLKILGIANSRFAEMIGARGPNTKINNACASTTTAISLAQDWIGAGRCKRVIVLGADNASGSALMEWVGSGFLATGAATTQEDVTKAALPFDKRRNGMIIGMGAVAIVIEQEGLPEARGIEPIADVLMTHIANSALHPTRLDVDHIAHSVGNLISQVEEQFQISRKDFAANTVFVSHETYTPARGGSAQTEIESLRRNFGENADEVVIANTKGFTGHAMGAGIEEVLALKALQHRRIPHIANYKDADPILGNLRLSEGGEYPLNYALRLAAGFGSQLALAFFRYRARTENRLFDPIQNQKWLLEHFGYKHPVPVIIDRVLRLTDDKDAFVRIAEEEVKTNRVVKADVKPKKVHIAAKTNPTKSKQTNNFIPKLVAAEAFASSAFDAAILKQRLSNKRVIILGGPIIVADLLQETAKRLGAEVLSMRDVEERTPLDEGMISCDLRDEDAIQAALKQIGRVDGIVNLLGFGGENATPEQVYGAAIKTFHFARSWRRHLGEDPSEKNFLVAITAMGGRLGFDSGAKGPLALAGAVAGFTKSIAREWEQARISVVDIPRDGLHPDLGLEVLWQAVVDNSHVEVGLVGGVKYIPTFVSLEDTKSSVDPIKLSKKDVILVTGGAKGISAEVCIDLAARYKCKLALVGRTKLNIKNPLSIDLGEAKKEVKANLKKAGKKVTPLAVKNGLWPLMSQREIAKNIDRMLVAGASDVRYYSADISVLDKISELTDLVNKEMGKIEVVIHGAGVEESRPILDKDKKAFDRVFVGKAVGGLSIVRALEKSPPKTFVFFSSVAGRFGNPGQVDYSSANDALNRLAARINSSGKSNALSIDWTAWDEVGMAADSGMKSLLEARGVTLLPPSIGAPLVGNLLDGGFIGEILIAGDLGDFAQRTRVQNLAPTLPLVSKIMNKTNDSVWAQREFNTDTDRFLGDHVYEGNPVVPGVMGLEFMQEAIESAENGPWIFTDVHFDRAVKLHRNEPVILDAKATRTASGWNAVVSSERKTKTGRIVHQDHFKLSAEKGDGSGKDPVIIVPDEHYLEGPDSNEIYKRYFHTGVFQVLDTVPVVGDGHVVALGHVPKERFSKGFSNKSFTSDPMVREMAFQAIGLWGMYHNKLSYLPYAIERVEFYAHALPEQTLSIRCKKRDDNAEHTIAFDAEVVNQNGVLLQRLTKVEMIGHRSLTESEQFNPLKKALYSSITMRSEDVERQLDRLSIDRETFLSESEKEAYERLISPKRKGEWMAARIAAKRIAVNYVRDFWGQKVDISNVEVWKNEQGAPILRLRDGTTTRFPHLSITHSQGVAKVALIVGEGRLGIDLEHIEAREASFARNYFTKAEINLKGFPSTDEQFAVLWSVKESVSKALGLGLYLRPEEVHVDSVQKTTAKYTFNISLLGEAKIAAKALGIQSKFGSNEAGIVEAVVNNDTVFSFAKLSTHLEFTEELGEISKKKLTKEELVAAIALLKHKGFLPKVGTTQTVDRKDIPNWKA